MVIGDARGRVEVAQNFFGLLRGQVHALLALHFVELVAPAVRVQAGWIAQRVASGKVTVRYVTSKEAAAAR